jgi:hypothetical protein
MNGLYVYEESECGLLLLRMPRTIESRPRSPLADVNWFIHSD